MKQEIKNIPLSFKDIDTEKGTGVLAHAVFTNIDRGGDQILPTAFDEQYSTNPSDIDFLFNHVKEQKIGDVTGVWRDNEKAYSAVKFSQEPLGQALLEMADQKAVKGVSVGYFTLEKSYVTIKERRVRKLKKLHHSETSLLTKTPMNPLAGVVTLTKSDEISNVIIEMKELIGNMERFYYGSKHASDDLLKQVRRDIEEAKNILSVYEQEEEGLVMKELKHIHSLLSEDNEKREISQKLQEIRSSLAPQSTMDYLMKIKNQLSA